MEVKVLESDQLVDDSESLVQGFASNYEAIIKLIDQFSFLDDLDKHWARKDAEESLKNGVDIEELKEKYQFYDQVAELQQQIAKNIPESKREEVLNIIRQVTSKPSGGSDRKMKLEHVLKVKHTVDAFRKNQISLQFLVQEKITSGDVHFGVAQILSEDIFKSVEKLFPDRFWKLSDKMTPGDFPHFTVAFNFALKESFTQGQSTSKLKAFSEKIKKSILEDAEGAVSEFFTEKAKNTHFQSLKKISADKPGKLLEEVLSIQSQREKNETEARKEFQNIQNLVISKKLKDAKKGVETLKNKFGVTIFSVLRQQNFITKLEVALLRSEEQEDAEEKKSIAAELEKKKLQDALEEKNKKPEEEKKDPKKDEKKEAVSEVSESKQQKIKFLEMSKEHARRVMEECGQLGIPKDSEEFWGLHGVRNRMQYLKDNKLWDAYDKFNSSDRNMPSKTYEGGFRFRWVNLDTGTNLNTTKAQRGIEYLRQRKESGYHISALAGAFSVNWKGHSSPVYTPERFMSFVEMELNRVKSSS